MGAIPDDLITIHDFGALWGFSGHLPNWHRGSAAASIKNSRAVSYTQ